MKSVVWFMTAGIGDFFVGVLSLLQKIGNHFFVRRGVAWGPSSLVWVLWNLALKVVRN
jgi:hypothetical protein